MVVPAFTGRVLAVDTTVARRRARLHVSDPRSDRDTLIAATVLVHGLTVVTRNVVDFEPTAVGLLNPQTSKVHQGWRCRAVRGRVTLGVVGAIASSQSPASRLPPGVLAGNGNGYWGRASSWSMATRPDRHALQTATPAGQLTPVPPKPQ